MKTQPFAFLTCKMAIKDAEAFIRNALENDIRGNNNIQVQIELSIRPFELFPCLVAAQIALLHTDAKTNNPKAAAMKALRDTSKANGMEIGLADAKAIVEAFIEV